MIIYLHLRKNGSTVHCKKSYCINFIKHYSFCSQTDNSMKIIKSSIWSSSADRTGSCGNPNVNAKANEHDLNIGKGGPSCSTQTGLGCGFSK